MSTTDGVAQAAIDTASKLAGNIYTDVASPAARRVGTALDTLMKIGLSPVSLLDWGFERSKDWLTRQIADRLSTTPEEFQQAPPSQIAVPLLLAIASSPECEELRRLYAELLMKAMDSRIASTVHPSYASILGQLTPQEALVVMSFRDKRARSLFIDQPRTSPLRNHPSIEMLFHEHCKAIGLHEPSSQLWLENLLRLRLLELNTYTDAIYVAPEYDRPEPSVDTTEERHLTVTEYGGSFIEACTPHTPKSEA